METSIRSHIKEQKMKYLNTFVGAAALALASYNVNAAPVEAGGVVWDEYEGGIAGEIRFQQWYSADSFAGTNYIDNSANVSLADALDGNGYLSGLGVISILYDGRNFTDTTVPFPFIGSEYCATGFDCVLTFAFGGLSVQSVTADGFIFDTSDAWLNIYFQEPVLVSQGLVDSTLHTKFASVQSGSLWASFDFDQAILKGTDLSGAGGTFEALLSITGGNPDVIAALDVNALASDFFLNSSALIGSSGYSNLANGQFLSTTAVPAPASIALLGLGLLGLAGGRRLANRKN